MRDFHFAALTFHNVSLIGLYFHFNNLTSFHNQFNYHNFVLNLKVKSKKKHKALINIDLKKPTTFIFKFHFFYNNYHNFHYVNTISFNAKVTVHNATIK
ncbi:hypothetical protein B4926_04025 [Vibrio cholerae]|nr:hypothetical protein [Vibrio cholerae]MCD1250692.1 hypothetical protein [Vibrio cholerae]